MTGGAVALLTRSKRISNAPAALSARHPASNDQRRFFISPSDIQVKPRIGLFAACGFPFAGPCEPEPPSRQEEHLLPLQPGNPTRPPPQHGDPRGAERDNHDP